MRVPPSALSSEPQITRWENKDARATLTLQFPSWALQGTAFSQDALLSCLATSLRTPLREQGLGGAEPTAPGSSGSSAHNPPLPSPAPPRGSSSLGRAALSRPGLGGWPRAVLCGSGRLLSTLQTPQGGVNGPASLRKRRDLEPCPRSERGLPAERDRLTPAHCGEWGVGEPRAPIPRTTQGNLSEPALPRPASSRWAGNLPCVSSIFFSC